MKPAGTVFGIGCMQIIVGLTSMAIIGDRLLYEDYPGWAGITLFTLRVTLFGFLCVVAKVGFTNVFNAVASKTGYLEKDS